MIVFRCTADRNVNPVIDRQTVAGGQMTLVAARQRDNISDVADELIDV